MHTRGERENEGFHIHHSHTLTHTQTHAHRVFTHILILSLRETRDIERELRMSKRANERTNERVNELYVLPPNAFIECNTRTHMSTYTFMHLVVVTKHIRKATLPLVHVCVKGNIELTFSPID